MATINLECTVNEREASVETEPDRPLLDVLREDLELTGTKYACGEGECGACAVLVDGRRALACQTPAEAVQGRQITTVEGLASESALHAVQEAFLAEGAFQCGYCTAGMIMSTVALLSEKARPSDAEIAEALNSNICRCGGYPAMLRAARRAAEAASRQEVTP